MATTSPAPAQAGDILDDAWLTRMLRRAHPDVVVTGHREVERLGTTATKLRLALTLDGAATVDAPQTLCIKAMLGEFATAPGLGPVSITEARFYDEFARPLAAAGLLTPPYRFVGFDDHVERALVTMDDLIVAGARLLTALAPYTLDQAWQSLDQLARLHAAS